MVDLAFWALVVLVLLVLGFFAALVRLYCLALRSGGTDRLRIARERRALDLILKQAASVAAVLAVFYGFVQFLEQRRQTISTEERTQFAKSMEKIVSSNKEANLGGITIVGQLAQTDPVRHWSMVEALAEYVRFRASRPQQEIRSYGDNLDKHYHDPPLRNSSPELKYNYRLSNPIDPSGVASIPAQLALTILGTRQTQFEDERFLQSVPRARIYLKTGKQERLDECTKTQIQEHIERDWMNVDRKESEAQLVREIGDYCPNEVDNIVRRPWLSISESKMLQSDLRNMIFEGAEFTNSDLSFSDFTFGKFAKAVFQSTSLVAAKMWGTDLRGADLRWADVRGTDLGHADLQVATLSGANFYRANFFQSNLQDAILIATKLQDLETMSGANVVGILGFRADFANANVAGDGQFVVCMCASYLKKANLQGANLRGVDMRAANLAQADLEGVHLEGADLREAELNGANLTAAHLRGAKLDGASFAGTDLSSTDLTSTDLRCVRYLSPDQIKRARTDKTTRQASRGSWSVHCLMTAAKYSLYQLGLARCKPRRRSWHERAALSFVTPGNRLP